MRMTTTRDDYEVTSNGARINGPAGRVSSARAATRLGGRKRVSQCSEMRHLLDRPRKSNKSRKSRAEARNRGVFELMDRHPRFCARGASIRAVSATHPATQRGDRRVPGRGSKSPRCGGGSWIPCGKTRVGRVRVELETGAPCSAFQSSTLVSTRIADYRRSGTQNVATYRVGVLPIIVSSEGMA
jgi:hypothetical protein